MPSANVLRGSGQRLSRAFAFPNHLIQTRFPFHSSGAAGSGARLSPLLAAAGCASPHVSASCQVASTEDLISCMSHTASGLGAYGKPHMGVAMIDPPFAVRPLVTGGGNVKQQEVATAESASGRNSADKAGDAVEAAKEEQKGRLRAGGAEVEQSDYWGIQPKEFRREDGTVWPWHSFRPSDSYAANVGIDLTKHFRAETWGDTFAYYLVKSMRIPTDIFFQKRYGCRAVMLETVAAVPGMVAGMFLHLRSLRRFEHTGGWIRALLEEAENERMHLMAFMEVTKPRWYERALVLAVQGVFFNVYALVYLVNPRLAHRVVGYLEEEAIHSYTEFLKEIDAGRIENVPAPLIAIDYWRLPKDATLRDVVYVVRADEAHHRDVNHFASNVLKSGKKLHENPAPVDYH